MIRPVFWKRNMLGDTSMRIILAIFMAFFFVSCTERTSSGPDNREDERIYGWRWDDFKPVPHASKMYGGVREIYHVGEWVVLMDDFYSSNEYTSPGKVTSTPRVFASKIGSTQWDTLTSSEWIRYIYGDSTGLYAGTELSGKVLKYDFNQHKWDDLYQLKFNPEGFYNVYGIATYRGNLVVCFAGYEDSTDLRQENIKLFMKMQTDTGWVDVTYDYDSSKEYPFQFHKGVELNGKLYAISAARGVWQFDGSWKRLARIPYPDWATWVPANDTNDTAMDIVVHKGKLYAIGEKFSTHVLEYEESLDRWNPIDSVIVTYDETIDPDDPLADPNRGYRTYHNTPFRRYALASDGKHLFVAGDSPVYPAVYMGDYGAPYGFEEKGWKFVKGNFCDNLKCLSTEATYDMEAIGDTLYLANWSGVLKFPLADLDSAIAKEESFPRVK